MRKEFRNKLNMMQDNITYLKYCEEDNFITSTEMAAKFRLTAKDFHQLLLEKGILVRKKIIFKRPLSKVKHPNRYKWEVAPKYRRLLHKGMISENFGPYKHSVHWRDDDRTFNFLQSVL